MATEVNDVSNTEKSLILEIKSKIERLEGSVRKYKKRVKNFQIVNRRSLLNGDKKISVLASQIKSVKVKLKTRKKKLQELEEKGKCLGMESQNICRMRKAAFENRKGNNLLDQNEIRGRQNKNHRNSNKEARPPNVEVSEDELPINNLPLEDAAIPQYICPRCQSSFDIFLQFSLHKHLCRSTAELHQCPVCLEEFEDIQGICLHLQDHEDDEESDEGKVFDERPYDDIGTDNCNDDDLDKSSAVSIVSPARSSHSHSGSSAVPPENWSKYQCSTCLKTFAGRDGLHRHLNKVHPEAAAFKCEKCDVVFAHHQGYTTHISSLKHKNSKPVCLKCPKCDHVAYSVAKLKSHVEVTKNLPNNFSICPHCTSKFCGKKSLANHIKEIHVKEVRHRCDFCSKLFMRSDTLRTHTKSHIAVSNHQCSQCKIYFTNHPDLITHEETQCKPSASYCCTKCGELFPNQLDLTTHQLLPKSTTVLISNTTCPHCDFCISKHNTYGMRRHIDDGIKSSNLRQCSVCSYKFCTLKSFKCHMKKNHPELIRSSKKLNCTNCQTDFTSRVSLCKHEITCKSRIQFVVENPDEPIVMSNKEPIGDTQISSKKLKPKSPPELEPRLNNSAKKVSSQIGPKSSGELLDQHHPKQNTVSKELLASTKYNCKFCEESLAKWTDFDAHAKIHPEAQGIPKKIPGRASLKFQCSQCQKEFSNQDSVFSHFLVTHAWLKPFHCNKCSLSFCTADGLRRHKNQTSHLDSDSSAVDCNSDYTISYSDEFSTDDDSD